MESIQVVSAYEQKILKSLPLSNQGQALAILEKSYALFSDRSKWIPLPKRISILEAASKIIYQQRESLALQATQEGGKPLCDSLVEIDRAIDGIKVAIKEITSLHGTEIPMGINTASSGRMAYTKRTPRGVIYAISAFNHPFNLIIHQVIPAIAAGCPVIIKPALNTPLSCISLVDILIQAGLPKQWCQVLLCPNAIAEILVQDKRISFLSFIGSEKVGWYLRSKLAPGATCILEHGGVAPAIIDKTADLKQAIPLLLKGSFYHAGQVCVSVQRIIIHHSLLDQFIQEFVSATKQLSVGDPTLPSTQVGPLIDPQVITRIESWVKAAIDQGATLLTGGEKIGKTCYAPTVLLNPDLKSNVSTQEIFGPVVCLYSYDNIDQAIALANNVDYCFQAAIFSNDLKITLKSIEEIKAMTVMVNDHTAFRVDWMPFGGQQNSGLGLGGIGHSIKDMMLEKLFVINQN